MSDLAIIVQETESSLALLSQEEREFVIRYLYDKAKNDNPWFDIELNPDREET